MTPDDRTELAVRLLVEFLALLFELLMWANEVTPPEVRNFILFFCFCLFIIWRFLKIFV